MTLIKKKHSTPYKHVGMAMVPPAAFTAVPRSPPPVPLNRRKKKEKIVGISPIAPMAITAAVIAKGVAMPHGETEIERMAQSRNPFVPQQKLQPMQAQVTEFDGRRQFSEEPATTKLRQAGHSQSFERSRQSPRKDIYTVPMKKDNRRGKLQQVDDPTSSLHATEEGESWRQAAEELQPAPVRLGAGEEEMDEMSRRQDEIVREMRFKDENTREVLLELMKKQHQHDVTETSKTKGDGANFSCKADSLRTKIIEQFIPSKKKKKGDNREQQPKFQHGQQRGGPTVSQGFPRDVSDVTQQNDILKEIVHRLTCELHQYQQKYGKDPEVRKLSKQMSTTTALPLWLTDDSYLSPLFISYDEQLQRKDDKLKRYKKKFIEYQRKIQQLSQKEVKIVESLCDADLVSQKKWSKVMKKIPLSLREALSGQNRALVDELHNMNHEVKMMQEKLKSVQQKNIDEVTNVSRLKQRLATVDGQLEKVEGQLNSVEEDLSKSEEERRRAQEEVERVKLELKEARAEHEKEMQTQHDELTEKNVDLTAQLTRAKLELAKSQAQSKQLLNELEVFNVDRLKLRADAEVLRGQLEAIERQQIDGQLHLANVIRVAERALCEKSTFAALAEQEQCRAESARTMSMREKYEIGRMEESLRQCKIKMAEQTNEVNDKLQVVEDSHVTKVIEAERENEHLKKQLRDKEQLVHDLVQSKRDTETELECVWQAAQAENRVMMQAMQVNSTYSPAAGQYATRS